ncbi:hypothetical protein DV515_00002528 [Chloebia gouldiae]|uniref:Uncharacterized protein n=1 Tax=Chloebia gouldiae TaxID=44316 RepID=A0A3L8SXD4_CHLGU|nr:hypothetical protein DV515_00002528 [Chloebia gouldiae]
MELGEVLVMPWNHGLLWLGREHRIIDTLWSDCTAKNIPDCLLTLVDSRSVFHSSCLGMAVAVGSSGRSSWRPAEKHLNKRCQKEFELLHNEICRNPT